MEKGLGTLPRLPRDTGGGYPFEPSYHLSSTASSDKTATAPGEQPACCSVQCCGKFARGCCTTLGVCLLVLGYTLLGAFMFLAIEGGRSDVSYNHVEPTQSSSSAHSQNVSAWLRRANSASRARAVENMWDITVSLNILYRDNWTRLAALELARFQDEVLRRAVSTLGEVPTPAESRGQQAGEEEWSLATAFLYSLTVLTTIGHGGLTPHTPLGKLATMVYAVLGIPLMLLYLSTVGSALAVGVRRVLAGQCPCRHTPPSYPYNGVPADKHKAADGSSRSVLAPVLTCVFVVLAYIAAGAAVMLLKWHLSLLDALFLCFMSLTTIGFGNVMGTSHAAAASWFCAAYILVGMAITATCFNVVHDVVRSTWLSKAKRGTSKLSKHKPDVTNNEEAAAVSSITAGVVQS